jgi:hypothetical protein
MLPTTLGWTRLRLRAILLDHSDLSHEEIVLLTRDAVERGGVDHPDIIGAFALGNFDGPIERILDASEAFFTVDA